ncbi:hypothetical protein [Allonocardiopsis opalescens]|uniref:Uncharacterized protein n=1 Tax=Allonocardiopsis opalescens TaxID=1144618 RepID=A0A2T0PP67_9ACTN|nr:hypothetical protein [Allonocardiopsis opalescens]PRX90699.1 hypothetical protein CLV72_11837 [Allonocardiopsis opalescens]
MNNGNTKYTQLSAREIGEALEEAIAVRDDYHEDADPDVPVRLGLLRDLIDALEQEARRADGAEAALAESRWKVADAERRAAADFNLGAVA